MKKMILSLAIAFMTLSATHAEGRLKLTVSIDGLPDQKKVYLYGMTSKMLDSTVISNHAFAFDKDIKKGDMFVIQVGGPLDTPKQTLLYLEPGTVAITGQGPYFEGLKYAGATYLQEQSNLDKMMKDTVRFKGSLTLDQDILEAYKVGDKERLMELALTKKKYDSIKVDMGKAWVVAHPNSPVSAAVLNFFIKDHVSMDSLKWYFSKLGPDAKRNFLVDNLALVLSTAVGEKAADFTQPDAEGHSVALSGFKGKYVLLDFWASWCKPCRELTPKLKAMYEKFKDQNFTILSVSLDTDKEKWMKAVAADGMTWPQVSDLAPGNKAAALYNVTAIPTSFLIDPQGKIVAIFPSEEQVEKILKQSK